MKRLAIIPVLLVIALTSLAETYSIYVSDQTGWSEFDLYAWGDSETFGPWPGATSASVVTIGGEPFRVYPYATTLTTMNMNLIFHNNVGEGQTGDRRQLIKLTEVRDYYLQVTNTSISEITPPEQPDAETLPVDNTTAISKDNRVIYELNLYDFTTAGTLSAARQRLPELRTLGIDIVWLMPIYPRGVKGKIGSLGSPYAPRDYTAVNPDHGTLQDLKDFVAAAHELGMSVWLDWVPNHTGLDHVWVTSHPEYYKWNGNEIVHPNDYGDVYQLDYNSSALCNAMTDAMLFWVEEADIDGFRCDYVSSSAIPTSYWQSAIPALQNNNRNKPVEMLGEADFQGVSRLYQAGFDYDYAWSYGDGLKAVGTGTSVNNAKNAANSLLNNLSANYANMSRMVYLTNHDDIGDNFSSNYITVLGDNVAPMTVMMFTFFGMPLLYNGQEIGQTKILNYFNRNPINWTISSSQLPIYNTIRSLVALKHTLPALADGTAAYRASTRMLTTNNNSVIAYERKKGDNVVLVVISLSNQPVNVTLSGVTEGTYTRVLDSETIASGCYTATATLTASPVISLKAKGYHVYTNTLTSKTNHIYVDDRTGWATFDLYEWGTPNEVFGGWPGATTAPTAYLYSKTWRDYAYTVSEETTSVTLNLIFHNNVGEGKTGDRRQLITLTEPRDYYLTVTDNDIIEQTPTGIEQIIDRSPFTIHKYIRDGHLIIVRDGVEYTAQGIRLK